MPSRCSPSRGAWLVTGGCLVLSMLIGVRGIQAASALSTAATALAAASSQCEPLPSGATPSPSPASSSAAGELCVSVQATKSSIERGQAASYTVQVSAENGPASDVSVTLSGAPQGEDPEFTSRCPSGSGSAMCTVGSLATAVSPTAYQMQAQIKVASGATSVTSVTLTATAGAATSPAMTEQPTAAETVTVSAPATAASTPAASSTPSPAASPSTLPVIALTPPTIDSVPTIAAPASTSLISPVNVASILPVISPAAVPTVGDAPSPVADTGTPTAGSFTVQIGMSAATAQLLGFVLLGLVLLLATTKLAGDYLTSRRKSGAKRRKKARAPEAQGTARRRFGFRRSRHRGGPRRWLGASRSAGQQAGAAPSDGYQAGSGPLAQETAVIGLPGGFAVGTPVGPAADDQP